MHIYLVGAGSMGSVHGGLLTRGGYEVTRIGPRADHAGVIVREGLTIEGVRGRHVIRLPAHTSHAGLPPADFAIIFTDANATKEAARTAAQVLKPDGFVLTLQNGIGNVEALVAELGESRVIAGVSMNSAANPEPGRAQYTNAGMTSIGELDGRNSKRIAKVARMLNKAEIETTIIPDPMAYIWGKIVLNGAIKPLTADTGLRNGEKDRTP